MAATMNAATFMGKNFQDNQNSIMNTTDFTLKKMFDTSAKLVGEQDEIFNVDKIHWGKHSWKTVINLQRAQVYDFSDSVLCLGRVHQHPQSNEAWKKRIEGITTDQSYREKTVSMGSRLNSSGTYSQDSQRCGSAVKS